MKGKKDLSKGMRELQWLMLVPHIKKIFIYCELSASEASKWDFNEVECRTSASTNERVGGDKK